MIKLWEKWAVMIDVNNICSHNCIYCPKHIRHLRKDQRWQMTEEEIIRAIDSLADWPGKIGFTGGEPLHYPDVERLCEIVRSKIPREKAIVFTSEEEKLKRYKDLLDKTFGEVYTNFHTPEQKQVCLHHPLLLAVGDLAPNKEVMTSLIEDCWCNKMWSPIIGKKGAFFCDCALGIDTALDMDGGWPVEPNWWKRESYRDQIEKYCHLCGMCLPYPAQKLSDETELISAGLYEKFKDHNLRNLEGMKVIEGRLTIEEIERNRIGWKPWHNRQDRGYEGPSYVNIRLAVVSAWYNEELLAPLFLKHYYYADEIHIILDTATNDRTREILKADPRVIIHEQTYPPDGLDWTIKQKKIDEVYAQVDADWVFVVDADEFLYKKGVKDIKMFLSGQKGDIMWARLWQVYRHESEGDIDYTKPPLLQRRHGIPLEPESINYHLPDRAYLKPIVIRGKKDPQWICGCHLYRGKLEECTDIMDGAHWHMADPVIAVRRRMQTKARQGKRNLREGLGIQNHYITEKAIFYECWLHRFDPIVVHTGFEDDKEKGENDTTLIFPDVRSSLGHTDYYIREIEKIFREHPGITPDELIQKVYRLFPELAIYLNYTGQMLLKRGNHKEAREIFEEGLKYDPTNSEIFSNLKKLTYPKGEYEKPRLSTKCASLPVPTVSIIIPLYNGLEYTRECLTAIEKNTPAGTYEIIIVDNGSTDSTSAYLTSLNLPLVLITNHENKGFTIACNQGAKVAKGDFLMFLNNDAVPKEGWIQRLLETFKYGTDIGAVGCKLVYPDGKLQEAGGIVFRDGNAWNFGREDNPALDRYNKLIEVDYCSAAALMVRKEIFEKVGGFDERYAPAYYEDTDLCFAIREKGFRVLYQPAAEIIHYEGKTAGTDTGKGFKKYQQINREKFREKWSHRLADQGPSPYEGAPAPFTADRIRRLAGYVHSKHINNFPFPFPAQGVNKINFLVIDPFLPVFDRASGSFRLFQIIKILATTPHVHVTYIARDGMHGEKYEKILSSLGIEVYHTDGEKLFSLGINTPAPPINLNYILGARKYHYAILSFYEIALQYLPEIRLYSPETRIVIDTVDIHFLREMRQAELLSDEKLKQKALNTKANEIDIYMRADALITVTPEDAKAVEPYVGEKPIFVIPNIHPIKDEVPPFQNRQGLIFIGNFRHPPNGDAICYYLTHVHSLMKKKRLSLPVVVVGDKVPPEIKELAARYEEVTFTGWVPDTRPYLDRARISIAPLRYGAGMKGKIGEALAYGLPVVTTSMGAEGMGLNHGENILIADTPEDFAECIIKLYHDANLWEQLSESGINYMKAHFSPEVVGQKIRQIFGLPQTAEELPVLREERTKLTSLIILSLNGWNYTRQCLESILQHTNLPYEIILVDNGSTDGTQEYIRGILKGKTPIGGYTLSVDEGGEVKEWSWASKRPPEEIAPLSLKRFVFIENKKNLGFPGGNNVGMAASRGDYILLLNNDIVVTPHWLEKLVRAAELSSTIGLVGPLTNEVTGPQRIKTLGYNVHNLSGLHGFSKKIARDFEGQVEDSWKVVGFCMLIKREVMEKIGGLDLRFGMGNFEDDDYCMRALLAGFKCQIARDCFVHHYGGRTFKSAGIDYGKAIMTNWEIFRKKWNLPEAGEGNNSYDIRHFLSQPFTKVRHYFPLGPEEFTVELGEALYLAGDVDGAKLCLDKVLERDPSNVEALNNLGFIAFQEGNLSQALSYLEEGLKINPDSCEILENLGQIYISKGDFSRAAAYLERALKLEPENVNLINNLANCLVQTGSHLAAESLYERSYELDRSQEHVREILALLKEIKGAQVGARA